MPFRSEKQRRKFWAMAGRGEISPKVVKEWEEATPKDKKLPLYAHNKAADVTRASPDRAPEHGPQNEPTEAPYLEKGAWARSMRDELERIVSR